MSSNSLQFKGLQHGKSLEAQSFLSQSVIFQNRRERASCSKNKLRWRFLNTLLIIFGSILGTNLMAQTGNSCSNPYVMNLTNGAGNAEFQFHYPDTVMYVKLIGIGDKQTIIFDSINNLQLNRVSCFQDNCAGNYVYDRPFDSALSERIDFHLNFRMLDTVLLKLIKDNNYALCNYCDSFKINISILPTTQATQACTTSECSNLIQNGSFEGFDEQYFGNFFANQQFTLNRVCSWNQDFVQYTPNGLNTPDYFNFWFDDQVGTQYIGNRILNPPSPNCQVLPEVGNPFYTNNFNGIQLSTGQQYPTNSAYAGIAINNQSEILTGRLSSPLTPTKKYYLETNIIKRNDGFEGGVINIDLSIHQNYMANNYNAASTYELNVLGFNYSPNWQKFNTIFTATAPEEYIYVGNLAFNQIAPDNSLPPYACLAASPSLYYLFDNFVVKEFFADAGNPAIACEGAPVQIGGNSCPFPNAVYNWQPAAYFVNNTNTLQNPTFLLPLGSGLSNVTCTLTVTIPMADGSFATTDPSYVNITIIQGSSITLGGTTTVLPNGIATLNANGGSNYVWTGSDGTSFTGASITTGQLTQDVTYTVTALSNSGCSVTETITVTVTPLPAACINDPNYPNAIPIPNGTSTANFLALIPNSNIQNIVSNQYIISNANFALLGQLILDNNVNIEFSNCHFNCFDASSIINNANLTMRLCTLVACNNLWKGITNNKQLNLNGCYIADAENAVHLANGSIYNINTNVFENNLYGIFMGGLSGGQISGVDYSNIFRSTSQLKPAYNNMFFHPTWSEAGIKVFNVSYVQIGALPSALSGNSAITISNRFENINCGINIFNSNVKVVNSWFKDLTHLNPSPAGTLIGLQPEGSGIYARSIGTPKSLSVEPIPGYSGNEFEKCKYGIKTFRNSIVANNIRMNNVANGITAQNTIMCSYNLQSNRINAWLNGIDINNAEFANNIVVAYNQISMNFLFGYNGINVTGATNGNVGNTRINNNNISIANTYNAGIQTSSLVGSLVNCNNIRRTLTNPLNAWYSLNGINSLACNNITLSQNTVSWAPGFNGAPNMGRDILLQTSDEAMVRCNTTGASKIGLAVSGSNANSTIRANNFGSNNTALYYDNTGITGPQPADPLNDDTEGNRWLGTNTYKAVNNAQPLEVNQSIYYVNANQPAINNPDPQLIFPQGWFDGSGLLTYQAPCLIQNCAGRMASSIGNKDFYRSIANRSLRTNGYPEQTLWMAQNSLIKLLTNDSILLNEDDSLQYFYYSPDAQVLRDIDEIGRNNAAFEAQRNLFSHAIIANDSLMSILETNYLALNSELTDSLANDSLILMQKIALLAQYESLKQVNEDLSNSLNAYHKANLANAYDLNSTLEPRNANEQILKTVNEIYFTLRDNDYEYISYEDSSMIAYIAHLCPLAAGPAVFQARDIYALLVDSVLYQDSANCSREGYARESLTPFAPKINNKVTEVKYFKAFPVPAQNSLNLSFNELKSAASVYVYDMEGRLMLSKYINSNSRNAQLELSQVPAGIYYVLLMNNERAERTKISVIK